VSAGALGEVLGPERYVERVDLATGEAMPGPIPAEELLVAAHRDGHPVDVYTRAVMGWLIDKIGREDLVRDAMREVRTLGWKTSDVVAKLFGVKRPEAIASALFGIRHQEHYFRFRHHGVHRAEMTLRLARLKEQTREKLEAVTRDGRPRLRVLLTGGTGFVGKEVLWQAAHHDEIEEVVVLIRPKRVKTDGGARVLSASERGRALLEELWLGGDTTAAKFRFVAGDITEPHLGIAADERARLQATVTHVVHSAASVAFDAPYDASFEANVLGSRNALAFSLGLQRAGGPFAAHVAIETSYIHGRQQRRVASEEEVIFPRNYYNNYYELTKAFASIETERRMVEDGLRVVQLCPSIVVGDARTGNNRGDLKVINAPVNVFGRAGEALRDLDAPLADRARAWLLSRFAQVFPGDRGAEINLVPVDRVAAGILHALPRAQAVGERIHLATDDRITADRLHEICEEELEVEVRLAEPTLHRNVTLPLLVRVLNAAGQEKLGGVLEKLGTIFGGYSEWGQPVHEVGSDVEILGLPAERPGTEAVFRSVCRHNRWVQRFGRLRDPDEISRRERAWAAFIDDLERRRGVPAGALSPEAFRDELTGRFDIERFQLRETALHALPAPPGRWRESFTPADAAWLHMEDPTNLMQITGVLGFDARLDLDRLRDVLGQALLRYPRFRMRVVDLGVGPPQWVLDANFEIDRHVGRAEIAPGREALERRVGELMGAPLDRRHPLWHYQVLDREGEGSVVVVRLHHAIADGIALMKVLLSITDEGRASRPAPEEAPSPLRDPVGAAKGALAATGRWAMRMLHAAEEVALHPGRLLDLARKPVDAAAELGHLVALPPDPPTPLRGPLGQQKCAAWTDPIPLEDVKRVKRRIGATVNDVLMAALTGGLRRYLSARGQALDGLEIRAIVPVDLRRRGDPALGNRFGLVFLALPLGVADPVERLVELKRRMDAIKRSPEAVVAFGLLGAMGMVPEALERRVVELFGKKATAVVTNVPGPPRELSLAGLPIRDFMFWVPQSARLGLGVSILSYAGNVRVGVASDAGLVPDPGALAAAMHEAFRELEAVGAGGARTSA
jgi:WS/DGAT/MGAT family acyltransferase